MAPRRPANPPVQDILRAAPKQAPHDARARGPQEPEDQVPPAVRQDLLNRWAALWTFAQTDGVEPTNNHAERGLRGASSTASSHSAANQSKANARSNDCSPPPSPADSGNSRSTTTSRTSSPPTPAATPHPASHSRARPEPLPGLGAEQEIAGSSPTDSNRRPP